MIICVSRTIMPSVDVNNATDAVKKNVIGTFTASVALFTSTLGIIVRDTQMIMQALLRILFYISRTIMPSVDVNNATDAVKKNVIGT
jgi:teichoic acid transport system permease protein